MTAEDLDTGRRFWVRVPLRPVAVIIDLRPPSPASGWTSGMTTEDCNGPPHLE